MHEQSNNFQETALRKDIKLLKEHNTGNCKNKFIYFIKGLQQSKTLKKNNKILKISRQSVLVIRLASLIKYYWKIAIWKDISGWKTYLEVDPKNENLQVL